MLESASLPGDIYRLKRARPEEIIVAIPALNEEKHIASVLHDLMRDAPDMTGVKIVVADGGSTDATRQIISDLRDLYPNVHLIDNPGRLQSVGCNLVVAHCCEPSHRVLVRVDAHSHYPEAYVLRVADSLLEHEVAGLATVMDASGTSCFQRGAALAVDTPLGSGGSGHRGGSVSGYVPHGHHAGFLLDIWRKTGGYNTDFVANEDAELDHRIHLAGGRIWLDADIRLGYVMRPNLRALLRQYWRYGVGRAQTMRLHRMKPQMRQAIPPLMVLTLLMSCLLSLLVPAALLLPLGYCAILAVTAVLLALRHNSLCALWAGPALAAMHLSWGAGFLWQFLTGRGARR